MGGGCLRVLAPLTASVSLGIVSVAILTNEWLHTEEKMPNPRYNGTGGDEYLSKITVSGLWTLCFTQPGEEEMHCSNIEYFPKEEYSPDPNDSTMAIPYAVTRSALFFIVSTLLLFCGEFSCVYGTFRRGHRIFTFVAGVVFIISGLLMLIGLVMYISVFKAEVGGKLRPRSQLQPPQFTFQYGYSFLLYVSGFVSIETAGTCAVFLYLYRQQRDLRKKNIEMTPLNHRPMLYPLCRRHPQYSQPLINHVLPSPCPPPRRLYLEQESATSPPLTPRQMAHSCVGVCMAPHDEQRHRVSSVSSYFSYPPDAYRPTAELEAEAAGLAWGGELPRDLTSQTVSTTADINLDDYPTGGVDYSTARCDYPPSGCDYPGDYPVDYFTETVELPPPLLAPRSPAVSLLRHQDDSFETLPRRTTPV